MIELTSPILRRQLASALESLAQENLKLSEVLLTAISSTVIFSIFFGEGNFPVNNRIF